MAAKNEKHPSARITLPRPVSVFDLRDTEVIPAESIPAASRISQSIPLKEKQGLLRFGESEDAELMLALHEITGRGDLVTTDLGRFAPTPGLAASIANRIDETRASNAKAQTLASFTALQEDVANHDAVTFLIDFTGEVQHIAEKDKSILDHYPKVMAFDAQRKLPAAEGRTRAKAEREAEANQKESTATATEPGATDTQEAVKKSA